MQPQLADLKAFMIWSPPPGTYQRISPPTISMTVSIALTVEWDHRNPFCRSDKLSVSWLNESSLLSKILPTVSKRLIGRYEEGAPSGLWYPVSDLLVSPMSSGKVSLLAGKMISTSWFRLSLLMSKRMAAVGVVITDLTYYPCPQRGTKACQIDDRA